ncbi:SAM-dependent methyltransferase [Treponema denticola]|uniref:SAM-dependent methyltransferase n=1 Tax=Treponema denticola TaxID=158 RepID=A0A9Q9BG86_TREDN|nr:SAM-dependent methyltransferase [Treponema denticola]UTC91312.1 SAM-dependent methyltransferase [Treponema denticola]UTC99334.1 SAM-dependent methyltransferase [Treponema denticola]UTD04133.1 SAM-dependent methyltransferase [Treponema denticola]
MPNKDDSRIKLLKGWAWLTVPQFENHLLDELGIPHGEAPMEITRLPKDAAVYGNIVYRENFPKDVFWSRLCMKEPFMAEFSSISEAADILRSIQRNWAFVPFNCFRRAELIEKKLPFISKKERDFPYDVPSAEIGIWTLLNENQILASAKTSSPFPRGEIFFKEDKINPPSRAYLKMWEALTLLNFYLKKHQEKNGLAEKAEALPTASSEKKNSLPAADSICLDAGACPGGWSWVLDSLGCKIIAIDRSPLRPDLMAKKNIEFIKHDAFTLKPEDIGKIDWLCSDVICYPPRLYDWVIKWIDSGLCEKFICTIKMQGEPDNETVKKFAAIPNSKIVHLTANKHELTWLKAPFI